MTVLFLALLISTATPAPAQSAESPAPAVLALGSVALGSSVLDAVKAFGPPDVLATIDAGHEWRWYGARGLDLGVITDDDLVIKEATAARPATSSRRRPALIQPPELPLLEMTAAGASEAMALRAARVLPQPEDQALAWGLGDGFAVVDLEKGVVRRVRVMDADAAVRLGYTQGPQQPMHRAPVLVNLVSVGFPLRALRARAEGVVVVRVDIDSHGAIKSTRVLVSSGNADIDAAEIESMHKSTFRAARCGDDPCDGVFLDRESYEIFH